MCGLAGVLDLRGGSASEAVVGGMAAELAHRGPDGEGVHVDRALGLGHRRLAVIDLSPAAAQPMRTADGRHVIAYNGEVYNYRELRAELEALGSVFRSTSDTEVVLEAVARWGPAAVSRFNGMFALAVWDSREQKLLLARDRYGIKPLYYAFLGGQLVFASEHKAILRHPEARRELDHEALLEYFTFQNLFTDRTLLEGIRVFPPGHWAVVSPGDPPRLEPVRYWDFRFREPDRPGSPEEYAEELDRLFRQAVRRMLVADVEIGSYLSGGMDSGSITAVAAERFPWIKTFTCGFDLHSVSGLELAYDEREKAEHLSYLLKTEHYEVVLKAGDMERVLPDLAWHLEEPRVGQSYPNWYVSKLASRFVKVVLAGTGGDELFAGYPWRYYRAGPGDGFEDYVDKYYLFWQRLVPNRDLQALFAPIRGRVGGVWTRDIFRAVFPEPLSDLGRPEDYVNHSLYFEAKTFLHGLLLVEDKLNMAHHLEVRLPFLDNDLVDFAVQVPVGLKLRNLGQPVRINENEPAKRKRYEEKTSDGKQLLRRVMAGIIPPSFTEGVKQGFSAPDASWFKGGSLDYVRSVVDEPSSRIYELFDRPTVRRLVGEHLEGARNRRLFIWSLLNLEWWLRKYL